MDVLSTATKAFAGMVFLFFLIQAFGEKTVKIVVIAAICVYILLQYGGIGFETIFSGGLAPRSE